MRKILLTMCLISMLPLGGCTLFASEELEVAAPAPPPPPPPPPAPLPITEGELLPDDVAADAEKNDGTVSDAEEARRREEEARRSEEDARRRYEEALRNEIDAAEVARDEQVVGDLAPPTALPNFPWPPPRWSARKDLTDIARHQATDLGALSDNLVTALNNAGYPEYSLYAAPGGFALVARLERTEIDGTPNSEFRFLSPREDEPFDLGEYISALFFTPEGYYRQIVFLVTDQPFVAAEDVPNVAAAERMLGDGASALDAPLRARPVTSETRVFALIYEFRKGAGPEDVAIITPGRLDGEAHLVRSGIVAALAALAGN